MSFRQPSPNGADRKENDTNDHETNSTRNLGSQASNASRATCQRKVQSMGRRMRRIWINKNGGETVCSQKPPTRSRSRRAGTARDLCDRSCRPRSLSARPTRLWRGRPALRRTVQTQERTHNGKTSTQSHQAIGAGMYGGVDRRTRETVLQSHGKA